MKAKCHESFINECAGVGMYEGFLLMSVLMQLSIGPFLVAKGN